MVLLDVVDGEADQDTVHAQHGYVPHHEKSPPEVHGARGVVIRVECDDHDQFDGQDAREEAQRNAHGLPAECDDPGRSRGDEKGRDDGSDEHNVHYYFQSEVRFAQPR